MLAFRNSTPVLQSERHVQYPSLTRRGVSIILLCTWFAATSGCGFHLRGQIDLPEALVEVALQGPKPYGELGVAIRNGFTRMGGQVVESPQLASSVLVITRDTSQRRVLSVDISGQANEYEVEYTLGFHLDDPQGTNLVVPQSITLRRQYRFEPTQTLAKADEEARLVREMREDAVRQMLHRLKAGLDNPVPTAPKEEPRAPAP